MTAPNPYESPQVIEESKPRSIRPLSGWILIVLGSLLILRVTWLSWWWWGTLREDEVNRILVLSTFGFILAMIGCWLRFRSILFLVPVAGILVLMLMICAGAMIASS